MRIVKPEAEHDTSRGVIGGAELSHATVDADALFMGVFRVPAGAVSRAHYHANCESGLYMLRGEMRIRFGEQLEQEITVVPGDLLYVPPQETHVLENVSETEIVEYVVARNAAAEDSVEVALGRGSPAAGLVQRSGSPLVISGIGRRVRTFSNGLRERCARTPSASGRRRR